MTVELSAYEQQKIARKMTDCWKYQRNYHISTDENRCCFTCMYGIIENTMNVTCKIKNEDLPLEMNYLKFSTGGVCDCFKSVYIEEIDDRI